MDETIIETLRAAVVADATPEARTAGIAACRAILAALEPPTMQPSQPSAQQPPQLPITAIAAALRGQSPDVLLDLAIAKLRTHVGADAQTRPGVKLNIPLINARRP